MSPLLLMKVSLLLSVTLLAARLLYRAPAATRHGLWSLAFGALLLLPPLAAALPALYVPMPAGWNAAPYSRVPSAAVLDLAVVGQGPRSVATSRAPLPLQAVDLAQPASSTSAKRTFTWPALASLFFVAWISGVLAAAGAVVISLIKVRRLIRGAEVVTDPAWHRAAATISAQLGLRYPVRLLLSAHVGTPMAGGLWNPAVFLPRSAPSWSTEYRDIVLAHELAHLAGRDPIRHLMARFALACYWFHPLAWLAAREASIAREQACDEKVLSMGARPSAYARVLLDLAESLSVRPPARLLGALPMVHRSHLEKRLMAILNVDARPTTRRIVVVPVIGVVLLTLSVAAAQPLDRAQAGTPSAAEIARFAEEHARPFAEQYARPFAERYARPFVEAFNKSSAAPQATSRDSRCWSDAAFNDFRGSTSTARVGGRTVVTDMVGIRNGDRMIQKVFGDLRLCMLAEGAGDRSDVDRPSQWVGRAPRIVMEAQRGTTVQRLELNGTTPTFEVGSDGRAFDPPAQAWRDRMLAVLDSTWEISNLHGEVSSLRGQISSIHGQRSALQGQISALQGAVSAMQGRISAAQGQESSWRGQISAIQGHVSSLQGAISAQQGAISSLNSSRYVSDATERNRISTRIAEHNAEIVRIEREIRDYDADRRIAAVQKELSAFGAYSNTAAIALEIKNFDLDSKVAVIERRITDLDVEGKVARIEREIQALDADRRIRELEDRRDRELTQLTSAIAAIR